MLTDQQAKKIYWKPHGFANISDARIALMIFDWTITSGKAVVKVKKFLCSRHKAHLHYNSHLDAKNTETINNILNQNALLKEIADLRRRYYTSLTVNPDGAANVKAKYLKGWLARVDDCLKVRP